MNKLLSILLLFSLTSVFPQSIQHKCSLSKINHYERLKKSLEINYPGDNRIDVTYYKLNLSISYDNRTISGIVTIKAKSESNDLTNVFFDLQSHFQINSVTINGNTITPKPVITNNKLNINLDKVYNIGEELSIDISYNGTPGSSGFGSFEFGEHGDEENRQPAIWTLSEPYGSSDWWPSKDTPADKADSSDVWVRADDFFVTVSNGKLMEEIEHGDGTKTYKWKNSYPIAHYLISLAMTNYAIYKNNFEYEPGNVMEVIHYNYPENFNTERFNQLDKTVNMLDIFSDLFGPYPFLKEKYGHAEFGWGGGMEHQTVSSMGSFGEGIVSHELAHQWFGDKITCADWQNIWLNEGFATYSEALYAEANYGKTAYQNYIQSEMGNAENPWTAKGAVGSIYVKNINSISEIFNGARSYAKGSTVLHMLRKVVGDEHFFNILKTYISHPDLAYNVAKTEDFQSICEDISGQDLDYFFNQWIFGENYPKYSISWNSSKLLGDSYKIDLTVNQETQTDPQFFTMPIDIKIFTILGDTTITIFNNQIIQNFELVVQGNPQDLLFDPENWILKDINSLTAANNNNPLPSNFVLTQNYPNPFNPSTIIQYSIPITSNPGSSFTTLRVFDLLGKEIAILVNEAKHPGNYKLIFDASNLSSGIYYYQLDADNFTETKKMILLK